MQCHTWRKRNKRPNVEVVFIRSRNGAPSPKGCMVNGQVTKAKATNEVPPPSLPPVPRAFCFCCRYRFWRRQLAEIVFVCDMLCSRPPYHTLPYYTTPYHTTPHHTTPHHTTPHHTAPHHTTPHHTTPRHTTPHHTTPHHTTPHHTTPHHTTPHHTAPHHTTPHHTMPYHTIPNHTIPYHDVTLTQLNST